MDCCSRGSEGIVGCVFGLTHAPGSLQDDEFIAITDRGSI